MAEQAVELAQYEAEMEKRKIDIEMQKAKMAREIWFKAQLAGKEYDLLSLEDVDSASNEENSVVENEVDHTFLLNLNYQSMNRQPTGLPTVTMKLPKGP